MSAIAYGTPRLERYRADDFSLLTLYRRLIVYRGVVHLLH